MLCRSKTFAERSRNAIRCQRRLRKSKRLSLKSTWRLSRNWAIGTNTVNAKKPSWQCSFRLSSSLRWRKHGFTWSVCMLYFLRYGKSIGSNTILNAWEHLEILPVLELKALLSFQWRGSTDSMMSNYKLQKNANTKSGTEDCSRRETCEE